MPSYCFSCININDKRHERRGGRKQIKKRKRDGEKERKNKIPDPISLRNHTYGCNINLSVLFKIP